ncbi:alginate lyase family protein [Candidatus Uhrbacteria bacterium]|nr:alginate lyase family protein [Candidatus Uhrbacteria bacterium]
MTNEVRNLLWRCVNPIFCARTLLFFVRRGLFSLQYRYTPPVWNYPKEVRRAFNSIIRHPERQRRIPSTYPRDSSSSPIPQNDGIACGRLKLATGFLEYDGEPNWHTQFDDPEQTMSLHRWHWLIYDEMDNEQGVTLMRSWLSAMRPVPEGISGTTYTTGERMVNALLFFAQQRSETPKDISAALLEMAYHVARHLEYHGTRGTGNHVVNNARALFFAGQMLKAKELSDLAFAIVKDALPWLVTEDGFLREESSHYHLLFTRWILEMYELAQETGHQEMEMCLAPWVKKLAERCWFFLVEDTDGHWQIPLIGDVSPDCTPEWLIHYLMPLIGSPSPQPSPIKGEVVNGNPPPLVGGARGGWQAFPESGWFRLNHGVHTLFWHIPQACMIHRASHGHADVCSFVFFASGVPVVIDPGRPTYKASDPLYIYSGGASAHTSLTIDSLGPFLYDRAQKFPAFYQKRNVFAQWQKIGDQFVFSISHTGFLRIQGDMIKHTRRFKVQCNRPAFEVEDELYGARAHAVETFFHFAPGIEGIYSRHSTGAPETISDWTCPAYGVMIPSLTTKVYCKANLPCTMTHHFSW